MPVLLGLPPPPHTEALLDRLQDTLGQLDYYQFEEVVTGMVAPSLAVPRLGWATSALLTFEQVSYAIPAQLSSPHTCRRRSVSLTVMLTCEALLPHNCPLCLLQMCCIDQAISCCDCRPTTA